MKIQIGLVTLLALSACEEMQMIGDCGASQMQNYVGQGSTEVFKKVYSLPNQANNSVYSIGKNEENSAELPPDALVIVFDVPEVHEEKDLIGAKATKFYCSAE